MKSEPNTYSIDDLKKEKRAEWDGIRNYQARNFMRDTMKIGDMVLFYHSNCKPAGVVGVARVCSAPYPDPTQFDPNSDYFDPKSDEDNPRWILVDLEYVKHLNGIVTLDDMRNEPQLKDMLVLKKGQRLSIQPVTKAEYDLVCKMRKVMQQNGV